MERHITLGEFIIENQKDFSLCKGRTKSSAQLHPPLGRVYMYPPGTTSPKGKLRLLYEFNPMAFLTEQTGGKCTLGFTSILELQPRELHERVPFFCGNKKWSKRQKDL